MSDLEVEYLNSSYDLLKSYSLRRNILKNLKVVNRVLNTSYTDINILNLDDLGLIQLINNFDLKKQS
jgi:hypothetical protein